MDIEFIAIGNELLNGRTRDENSFWLSRLLAANGQCLYKIVFVPDDPVELADVFRRAMQRSDIIITSGGLGPTQDDITKKVLADTLKLDLEFSHEALETVSRHYRSFEKIPTLAREGYAHIPQGFQALSNPQGLAPGLFAHLNLKKSKAIFCAPGVPREFRAMAEEEFLPLLRRMRQGGGQKESKVVCRTHNIPEEEIFFKRCPGLWDQLSQFGTVSSLPQRLGVDITVTFSYETDKEQDQLRQQITETLLATALADHVWNWGDEEPEELILQLLRQKGQKLALAESCTGGLFSSLLTDIPGCSDVFQGSCVVYTPEQKQQVLNIESNTLTQNPIVSLPVAQAMAQRAQDLYQSDWAIATTGVAGPSIGPHNVPVGTICLGLAGPHGSFARSFQFKGARSELKKRFCRMGLFLLLEEIRRSENGGKGKEN